MFLRLAHLGFFRSPFPFFVLAASTEDLKGVTYAARSS